MLDRTQFCICENIEGTMTPFGFFLEREDAMHALRFVSQGIIEER